MGNNFFIHEHVNPGDAPSRTLLTELDGRRGQCRTRARPGAPSPSLRREWVVHYQWGDVLLVEGRDALEGG